MTEKQFENRGGTLTTVLEQGLFSNSEAPSSSVTTGPATVERSARRLSPSPSYRSALPPTYHGEQAVTLGGSTMPIYAKATRVPEVHRLDYVLRGLLFLLEAVGIILFGASQTKVYEYYYGNGFSIIGMAGLGFGLLITFCFIIGMFVYQRKGKGSIHPGCIVGWDLVAWMALLSFAVLETILFVSSDNYYDCVNLDPLEFCQQLAWVRGRQIAAFVMMYLAMLLHFYFFVKACRAVDLKRIERKASVLRSKENQQTEFELASHIPGRDFDRAQSSV